MSISRRLFLSVVLLAGLLVIGTQAAGLAANYRASVERQKRHVETAAASLAWVLSQSHTTPTQWQTLATDLQRHGGYALVRIQEHYTGRMVEAGQLGETPARADGSLQQGRPSQIVATRTFRSADGTYVGSVAVYNPVVPILEAPFLTESVAQLVLIVAGLLIWYSYMSRLYDRLKRGPMKRLTDNLAHIGQAGVDPKLAESLPRELQPLGTALIQSHQRVHDQLRQQRARIDALENETYHDPVTRLPNRKFFNESLRRAVQRDGGVDGHLLIFRQRDMAEINRQMKREATDQWLRLACAQLGKTIKEQAGAGAVLVRINGSDFAALLPGLPSPRAAVLAERLRRELRVLRLPLRTHGWCRWAMALTPYTVGEQGSDILARLDHALMRAEIAESDEVEPAFSQTGNRIDGEYGWQDILTRALEQHRFFLTLYPRQDAEGQVLHTEAQLTLRDQDSPEPLHAQLFMPPAARLGLSADCDIQAIRMSMDQLVTRDGDMVVRVSLPSLEQAHFLKRLEDVLRDRPEQARHLIIEIDAHGLVDYFHNVQALCEIAARTGVRVGVRRLSEQFAALERLHQLPLAYLKIGGSFVQGITRSPGNQQLAGTVIQVARTLDIPAYAEGAEEPAARELLQAIGFRLMQDADNADFLAPRHNWIADLPAAAPAAAEDSNDTAAHAPAQTRATDGRPWPPHELGLQRKRQEQSDRRLAEVARALEAQRQVHALLSHELRTPAATISAAAQSLEIILAGSGQEVDSRLARIRRAVTRMIELMNQVLSPERLRDQALTPRPEPIELGELARDTVEGMRLDTAHPLVLNAEAAVPAWCDPLLTALVVRNLIHNAVKYSPADQPVHIDVGLSYGAHGATAWVAVTDHGPGIGDDESQRIFEEHYRRAAHRETPGSGLGLHLARQICQGQDGTLTVQTQLGQGARFVITLPTPGQAYTDGGNAQAANT